MLYEFIVDFAVLCIFISGVLIYFAVVAYCLIVAFILKCLQRFKDRDNNKGDDEDENKLRPC